MLANNRFQSHQNAEYLYIKVLNYSTTQPNLAHMPRDVSEIDVHKYLMIRHKMIRPNEIDYGCAKI